jgi:hypothetical protein
MYARELGMTALARSMLKVNTSNVAVDLAAEMAGAESVEPEAAEVGRDDEDSDPAQRNPGRSHTWPINSLAASSIARTNSAPLRACGATTIRLTPSSA